MDHLFENSRVFFNLFLEFFEVLLDKVIDHYFSLVISELLHILDLPVVDGLRSFPRGDLHNSDLSDVGADRILTGLFSSEQPQQPPLPGHSSWTALRVAIREAVEKRILANILKIVFD